MKYIFTVFVLLALCGSAFTQGAPPYIGKWNTSGTFIFNSRGDSAAIIVGTDTTWFGANIIRRGLDTISELGPAIEGDELGTGLMDSITAAYDSSQVGLLNPADANVDTAAWNAAGAGEANTLSDTGTYNETEGFGLAGGKTGTALKVKGLIEGSNITIAKSGDSGLTITSSGGAAWVASGDTMFMVDGDGDTLAAFWDDDAGNVRWQVATEDQTLKIKIDSLDIGGEVLTDLSSTMIGISAGQLVLNVGAVSGTNILNQTIHDADMDTTGHNFPFDGAYHVTTETEDSAYITIQTLEDTATAVRADFPAALTNQGVKGDHVDSTAEDFVFVNPYKGTSAVADSVLTTRKELGDSTTAVRADFPAALTNQGVKGDHIDSTAENFVFDDPYKGTSAVGDSVLTTRKELGDTATAVRGDDVWLSQEQVDDYINNLLNDADAVHTRITITYDDPDAAMDFVVDDMTFTAADSTAGDVDSTGTEIAAALADRANIHDTLTMSFVIVEPAATHDFPFTMLPKAITIIAASGVCISGTNVVGVLMEYDNDAANPVVCNASDWTFTTGEERTTDLSNASIDAGDWLGWKTESVSGEVVTFSLTLEYIIN